MSVDYPEPTSAVRIFGKKFNNVVYRELRHGPKIRGELSRSPRSVDSPVPCETFGPKRAGGNDIECIWYLVGDERAASRRFLDVNHDIVVDAFTQPHYTKLHDYLNDYEMELLREEYEYRRHGGDIDE